MVWVHSRGTHAVGQAPYASPSLLCTPQSQASEFRTVAGLKIFAGLKTPSPTWRRTRRKEAVSSKQVWAQLCHSVSSGPWNNFTESKEPYSEFIAVPEKSFAPQLCYSFFIGSEWLLKSSSQPPLKPHGCWCCCCLLQNECSDLCSNYSIQHQPQKINLSHKIISQTRILATYRVLNCATWRWCPVRSYFLITKQPADTVW